MTEYELLDLWLAMLEFAVTVVVAFLSATSALLIVAHLKGKDFSPMLFRMVTAVYCVAAAFFLIMCGKTSESALDIRGQMLAAGIDWHNTVYEPQLIAPLVADNWFRRASAAGHRFSLVLSFNESDGRRIMKQKHAVEK